MEARIECRMGEDGTTVEVDIWVDLGFDDPQRVMVSWKEGSVLHVSRGQMWLPQAPIQLSFKAATFEQGPSGDFGFGAWRILTRVASMAQG
ncbi:MAG: hypothetical protein M5U22_08095 [Thermoleophilia bacterium]|nr:hypothetical protein [Thermoleophilia bacterium]